MVAFVRSVAVIFLVLVGPDLALAGDGKTDARSLDRRILTNRTYYVVHTASGLTAITNAPLSNSVQISLAPRNHRHPSDVGVFRITNAENCSILIWNVRVQVPSAGRGTDGLGWDTVQDDYPTGTSHFESHQADEIYVRRPDHAPWRVCILYSKEVPAGDRPNGSGRSWVGDYEVISKETTD